MTVRAEAARIINEVAHGTSLANYKAASALSEPDQAFLQALCYGVCRWYYRLHALASLLLEKPLKEKDQDIYHLILVGLFQLTDMRVPPHAAVAATVAATTDLNKTWAKGLVNAVLRNYQRQADDLQQKIAVNEEAAYAHPAWMIGKLKKNWPTEWQNILTANNQHPPFALRINQQQISRTDYLRKLAEANIQAEEITETAAGIVLKKSIDVLQLPDFKKGSLSVQDGAAQLAAPLLNLQSGQRVLDACAAPGGKATHILELEPTIAELVAIDHAADRMQAVIANLERLHQKATCLIQDVGETAAWWDGQLFERILLDAPCSGSGVMRRHPDIKLLRRPEDIQQFAHEQLRLLRALWPLLKPEGILLYVTCSVFAEENSKVIEKFLLEHSSAKEDKIKANWGMDCTVGKQILPGMHGMDGFYFVRLRKFL